MLKIWYWETSLYCSAYTWPRRQNHGSNGSPICTNRWQYRILYKPLSGKVFSNEFDCLWLPNLDSLNCFFCCNLRKEPEFLPGKQASIIYKGKHVGNFGIVHPEVHFLHLVLIIKIRILSGLVFWFFFIAPGFEQLWHHWSVLLRGDWHRSSPLESFYYIWICAQLLQIVDFICLEDKERIFPTMY